MKGLVYLRKTRFFATAQNDNIGIFQQYHFTYFLKNYKQKIILYFLQIKLYDKHYGTDTEQFRGTY